MTNEELIEEILIKAHDKGIRTDVIQGAIKLMDTNTNLAFCDAIQTSYSIEKRKFRDGQQNG